MDRVAPLAPAGPATCVPGELAAPAGVRHQISLQSRTGVMARPDDVPGHLTLAVTFATVHATACLACPVSTLMDHARAGHAMSRRVQCLIVD